MPPSLLWLPFLAVLLLLLVIRLMRPRASWESFRAGALADAERIRQEARRATEAICGEEALLPLRALLRELPLPAGISVREEDAGPEELRMLVTSPEASLMVRLSCSACRKAGHLTLPGALWLLALRDAGTASAGTEAFAPDVWVDSRPGIWPVEESFDDLAACAARLQNLVVDPASALESLYASSDIASEG